MTSATLQQLTLHVSALLFVHKNYFYHHYHDRDHDVFALTTSTIESDIFLDLALLVLFPATHEQ